MYPYTGLSEMLNEFNCYIFAYDDITDDDDNINNVKDNKVIDNFVLFSNFDISNEGFKKTPRSFITEVGAFKSKDILERYKRNTFSPYFGVDIIDINTLISKIISTSSLDKNNKKLIDLFNLSMNETFDILVIGGGINGAGIVRDASGRNLKVCLVEKNKVGSATSSWSTKLIHGGLRYLENYEFRLVRESLKEREVIKKIASNITTPLPFIIPYQKSLRPKWLIKLGLFLYDNIGGKMTIPKSSTVNIKKEMPNILKDQFKIGFQYYDLQVDDKKLVQLNVEDAKKKGAMIIQNRKVIDAKRNKNIWDITLDDNTILQSKILINAAGPWINEVLSNVIKLNSKKSIRLVKGSHIITKSLYSQKKAFTLQNEDNRIIFVIPYKDEYSLIGTTETEVVSPENPKIDESEIDYLLNSVNKYFIKQISRDDIVNSYSGIRPLIEDFKEASKVTRDYIFDLNEDGSQAPLLNIYGGKLTTYRKLAENVLLTLNKHIPINKKNSWTAKQKL